jgi:hypothetical protein
MHIPDMADKRTEITKLLAENAGGILETIAAEHAVSTQFVTECLPDEAWRRCSGEAIVEILGDVATWGDVTFIVHTRDVIAEVSGPFPAGNVGHGMYNLKGGGNGFSGHLRYSHCRSILFVRRPFMGTHTLSIQFFNGDGEPMFKIYVGRDKNGVLRQDQIERFEALALQVSDKTAAGAH